MAKGRRRLRETPSGGAGNAIPHESQVYNELIHEALQDSKQFPDSSRPKKKRRPNNDDGSQLKELSAHEASPECSLSHTGKQVAFEDFDSPSESEFEWEDVGFQDRTPQSPVTQEIETKDITISLGAKTQPARQPLPRKSLPAIERNLRIELHKVHLSCQLSHVYMRNAWCNEPALQAQLRQHLTPQTISNLTPSSQISQFMRTSSLIDGLKTAVDFWKANFNVTTLGLQRPLWVVDLEDLQSYYLSDDYDQAMTKFDFYKAAETMEGSADTGSQLFCALLRSAGVDARLVSSLQLLPIRSTAPATAPSAQKRTIFVDEDGRVQTDSGDHNIQSSGPAFVSGSSSNGLKPVQRFGHSRQLNQPVASVRKSPKGPKRKRSIQMPQFPVYWVEVFNDAVQKWIPVDPLVTTSVNKASKFEPPLSSTIDMSYVFSFEGDGTLMDVTRRYTKAYNAKTRRTRLESIPGGEKWLKKIFKIFDNGLQADRDQVEAAELAHKEASEPLPRNVQDFKDHPYYALARHLRQDEVIYPQREVGKFTPSKHISTDAEPIYRRRDVLKVRSADKWFRLGRELKDGEQPLRHALPSKVRRPEMDGDEDLENNESGMNEPSIALYAEFQTSVYIPPPVVNGQIPRNAFGNLDVYVPSMIPAGGVHVRIAEASKAARTLGIDYAEAVTGFEFKGRRGTAITFGVVVAEENLEALVATIEGLWAMADEAAAIKQSRITLKLWKRFAVGLRIRDRVMGDADTESDVPREGESEDEGKVSDGYQEGGFMPDTAENTSNSKASETPLEPLPDNEWESIGGLRLPQARSVPRNAIIFPPRPVEAASGILPMNIEGLGHTSTEIDEEKPNATLVLSETDPIQSATPADNIIYSEDVEAADMGGGFVIEDDTSQSIAETSKTADNSTAVVSQEEQVPNHGAEGVGSPADSIARSTGSMLSHDPEDEDAEPEWLVDDVEL